MDLEHVAHFADRTRRAANTLAENAQLDETRDTVDIERALDALASAARRVQSLAEVMIVEKEELEEDR